MAEPLKVIEHDLVPVYETDVGEKVVDGRELHEALKSKQDFSTWVKRRLSACDARENKDFTLVHNSVEQVSGTKHRVDYIIKLDIAKEMAMLEQTEIGKEVRKYFIAIEEKYNNAISNRTNLSPTLQMVYALADNSARIELEQKRQAEQLDKVEQTVSNMKEILTTPIGDWQAEINTRIREIAINSGMDYEVLYTKMYGELETTAHCSLKSLQTNKKKRMEKAGNTKTAITAGTKRIAIIADKPQLKAIFEGIVRRYAMSYCS